MIVTDPVELTRLVHDRLPDNWGEFFTSIDESEVVVQLPWADQFAGAESWGATLQPVVSGPTTMGLADTAMYGCCLAAAGPNAIPVIVTITSTYLSPAEPSDIEATASLLRYGRRLSYLECSLRNRDSLTPFLRSAATYAIRTPG